MPSLILHEPAPSHPQVMGFGRGGAGNRTHAPPPSSTTSATTSTSSSHQPKISSSSSSGAYMTGRGGAGNAHPRTEERRLFSFDEELALQNRVAPVFHIGRGGQGNLIVNGSEQHEEAFVRGDGGNRRSTDSRSSRGSSSSSGDGSTAGSVRRGTTSSGAGMGWIKGLARRS